MLSSVRINASKGKSSERENPLHSSPLNRKPVRRLEPVLAGILTALWLPSGMAQTTSGVTQVEIPPVADQSWEMVGTGDFDGDGKADLLWRHAVTGNVVIWPAANIPVVRLPTMTDLNWKVKGVADFDGDGKVDILWRHAQTGQNTIWKVDIASLTPGSLQFSTISSSVTEGVAVGVIVTRTGGSAGAVSATVGLSGTATNGADYTVNPTTVSFAAGDTASKTITLNVLADGVTEPSETAILTLGGTTGGALLGNQIAHTVTISDAPVDPPPGGGIPPNCPDQTFPLANIRDFTWFGGGLTQDVNLASGQTLAYRFTLGANGAVMDFTTNTLTGGQLGKDVAISACPGQFTQLANAECIKTFSTQDTRIFVGSTLLCPLPAGTYFVNIRPSPVGSGGVRSLKMGGFAL